MPSPKLSPAVARTAMVVDVDIAGHAARAGGGSKQPPRRMHGRRHGRRPRPHRRRFRKPEPNIVCVALENAECAPLATLLLSLAQKPPAGPGGVAIRSAVLLKTLPFALRGGSNAYATQFCVSSRMPVFVASSFCSAFFTCAQEKLGAHALSPMTPGRTHESEDITIKKSRHIRLRHRQCANTMLSTSTMTVRMRMA